jgi:hypothetical protein
VPGDTGEEGLRCVSPQKLKVHLRIMAIEGDGAHAGPDTIRAGVGGETNLFGTHQRAGTSVGRPAPSRQHSEYASHPNCLHHAAAASPRRRSRPGGVVGLTVQCRPIGHLHQPTPAEQGDLTSHRQPLRLVVRHQ